MHNGIGKTPLARWDDGILGLNGCRGTGMPDRIQPTKKLRLDFLPYVERVIRREGVAWENIYYYNPALSRWIGETDAGKSIKHVFRRDPRDISMIYFWDEEIGEYIDVPYRDQSHPSMSLWELRSIQKKLKEEGIHSFDEEAIFRARGNINTLIEDATEKTRQAKREEQKRKNREQSLAKSSSTKKPGHPSLTVVGGASATSLPAAVQIEDDDEEFDIPDEELVPDYEEI